MSIKVLFASKSNTYELSIFYIMSWTRAQRFGDGTLKSIKVDVAAKKY